MKLTEKNIEQWKLAYDKEYEQRTGYKIEVHGQMSNADLLAFFEGYTVYDAVSEELSNE